jgi:hypothetical protein
MENYKKLLVVLALALPFSCKDEFLEVTPNGVLSSSVLATKDGVNTLLIGTYSMVQTELTRILNYEKTQLSSLYGAAAIGAEDVNFPVPQGQIDLMGGRLVQNR